MKNGTASRLEAGQLAELASAIVRQLPHVEGLGEVAQGWIENGSALKAVLWESLVQPMMSFEQAGTVRLPAVEKFYACDYFTPDNKEVSIASIEGDFEKQFFNKVEESQKETELNISILRKPTEDIVIVALLRSRIETSLASIWELLKRQPNGESGKLLSGVLSNVFYVPDINGYISAVRVVWRDFGWCINTYRFGTIWKDGTRIFSNNS